MARYAPSELAKFVDTESARLGPTAMLTARAGSRVREMWCAATFGRGYSASFAPCHIDIEEIDEQREFDFHLETAGSRLPFQLAEVLHPGRRRGEEYFRLSLAEVAAYYRGLPPLSSSEAATQIKESLESKVAKWYAGSQELNILLYLNLSIRSLNWATTAASITPACFNFASTWLMSEDSFTCMHGGTLWPPSGGWHAIARGS